MKKQILLIIINCLLITFSVFAQWKTPTITPQSPSATSLGKYSDTHVSLYTGQINPSIPIYEIKLNDYTFPIQLSYSSSGLKLHDYPSSVGMGWTLNNTGVISRQTRGIPDETTYGFVSLSKPTAAVNKFIATSYPVQAFPENDPHFPLLAPESIGESSSSRQVRTHKRFITRIGNKEFDGEPDIFTMSAPGISGKFFFDETAISGNRKTPVLVPKQPLSVVGTFNSFSKLFNFFNRTGEITGFVVKDANGVKYTFNTQENTSGGDPLEQQKNTNAWYLTQIVTPNGNTLDFEYNNGDAIPRLLTLPHTVFESKYLYNQQQAVAYNISADYSKFIDEASPLPQYDQSQVVEEKVLTKITINNGTLGTIEFKESSRQREDWKNLVLSGSGNYIPKAMEFILIKDAQGVVVKKFGFDYDYDAQRLLLKAFSEINSDNSESISHTFEYYDEPDIPMLPNSNLNAALLTQEDFWGYYNKNTSNSLLPDYYTIDAGTPTEKYIIHGKNRTPDASRSVIGQLKRINYPTCGYSSYVYEANEYYGDRNSLFNSCSGNPVTIATANLSANERRSDISIENTAPEPKTDFTVPSVGVSCYQLVWRVNLYAGRNDDLFNAIITVKDITTGRIVKDIFFQCNRNKVIGKNGIEGISLRAGNTYQLFVTFSGDYLNKNNTSRIEASVEKIQTSTTTPTQLFENRITGGVRIKRTEDCADATSNSCIIKDYSYQDESDNTKSSGRILSEGKYNSPGRYYFYLKESIVYTWGDDVVIVPFPLQYLGNVNFQLLNSRSELPLAITQGLHIGYNTVTVRELATGTEEDKGKVVTNFYGVDDYPDIYYDTYPNHIQSRDWKRGQVKSNFVYGKDAKLLKKIVNQVSNTGQTLSPYNKAMSTKTSRFLFNVDVQSYEWTHDLIFQSIFYRTTSDFQYPKSSTSNEFFYTN